MGNRDSGSAGAEQEQQSSRRSIAERRPCLFFVLVPKTYADQDKLSLLHDIAPGGNWTPVASIICEGQESGRHSGIFGYIAGINISIVIAYN